MADTIFIDDGYTQTRTIAAVPGLHPQLTIIYRPVLSKDRWAFRHKVASVDSAVADNAEKELIGKQCVSLNGEVLDKKKIAILKPTVQQHIVDSILGYAPGDEAADLGN